MIPAPSNAPKKVYYHFDDSHPNSAQLKKHPPNAAVGSYLRYRDARYTDEMRDIGKTSSDDLAGYERTMATRRPPLKNESIRGNFSSIHSYIVKNCQGSDAANNIDNDPTILKWRNLKTSEADRRSVTSDSEQSGDEKGSVDMHGGQELVETISHIGSAPPSAKPKAVRYTVNESHPNYTLFKEHPPNSNLAVFLRFLDVKYSNKEHWDLGEITRTDITEFLNLPDKRNKPRSNKMKGNYAGAIREYFRKHLSDRPAASLVKNDPLLTECIKQKFVDDVSERSDSETDLEPGGQVLQAAEGKQRSAAAPQTIKGDESTVPVSMGFPQVHSSALDESGQQLSAEGEVPGRAYLRGMLDKRSLKGRFLPNDGYSYKDSKQKMEKIRHFLLENGANSKRDEKGDYVSAVWRGSEIELSEVRSQNLLSEAAVQGTSAATSLATKGGESSSAVSMDLEPVQGQRTPVPRRRQVLPEERIPGRIYINGDFKTQFIPEDENHADDEPIDRAKIAFIIPLKRMFKVTDRHGDFFHVIRKGSEVEFDKPSYSESQSQGVRSLNWDPQTAMARHEKARADELSALARGKLKQEPAEGASALEQRQELPEGPIYGKVYLSLPRKGAHFFSDDEDRRNDIPIQRNKLTALIKSKGMFSAADAKGKFIYAIRRGTEIEFDVARQSKEFPSGILTMQTSMGPPSVSSSSPLLVPQKRKSELEGEDLLRQSFQMRSASGPSITSDERTRDSDSPSTRIDERSELASQSELNIAGSEEGSDVRGVTGLLQVQGLGMAGTAPDAMLHAKPLAREIKWLATEGGRAAGVAAPNPKQPFPVARLIHLQSSVNFDSDAAHQARILIAPPATGPVTVDDWKALVYLDMVIKSVTSKKDNIKTDLHDEICKTFDAEYSAARNSFRSGEALAASAASPKDEDVVMRDSPPSPTRHGEVSSPPMNLPSSPAGLGTPSKATDVRLKYVEASVIGEGSGLSRPEEQRYSPTRRGPDYGAIMKAAGPGNQLPLPGQEQQADLLLPLPPSGLNTVMHDLLMDPYWEISSDEGELFAGHSPEIKPDLKVHFASPDRPRSPIEESPPLSPEEPILPVERPALRGVPSPEMPQSPTPLPKVRGQSRRLSPPPPSPSTPGSTGSRGNLMPMPLPRERTPTPPPDISGLLTPTFQSQSPRGPSGRGVD